MTLAEAQARLAKVREQIDLAIGGGATTSFAIRGRSMTFDLKFLQDEERRLETFVAMHTDGAATTLARFRDC